MFNDGLINVLFLLLSGGIIAYLGDIAGRRYSKSKKRLLGLRPKYASAIWAGMIGFLVSAFIYGLLSFVSSDFQDAVFRIQAIKKELAESSEQLQGIEDTYSDLQISYQDLEINFGKLEIDLDDSNNQIQDLTILKEQLEIEIMNSSKQAEVLNAQIQTLKEQGLYLNQELSEKENQVLTLKEEEKKLNDSISELSINLQKTENELLEKNNQLDDLQKDLLQLTAALNDAEVRASEGTLVLVKGQELKRLMVPADLDPLLLGDYLKSSFQKMISDIEGLGVSFAFETADTLAARALGSKKSGNYFLRTSVLSNVFVGDAVKVIFEWVPSGIIFKEGEVLAERFFEDTALVQNNYLFLQSLISLIEEIAESKGIFPDVKTQKRVFYPTWKLTNRAEEMVGFENGALASVRITKDIYNFESMSKIEIIIEGQ
ncbi:hypothetical protein CL643_00735 [bacterium]|nr:hypothetical protein [bacterium]|tara:strand:- start:13812 stop:15101 length:1290 start_codon:yes stop_codon:yes gene_type:complete